MRQNFKQNKRRIEEAKKKKQEAKRNKRLEQRPAGEPPDVMPGPPPEV